MFFGENNEKIGVDEITQSSDLPSQAVEGYDVTELTPEEAEKLLSETVENREFISRVRESGQVQAATLMAGAIISADAFYSGVQSKG